MSTRERIRIGPVRISLETDGGAEFLPRRRSYAPFMQAASSSDSEPIDLTLRASIGALPQLPDPEAVYDANSFWVARRSADQLSFECRGRAGEPNSGPWRVMVGDRTGTRWHSTTVAQPDFLGGGSGLPDPLVFPSAELILIDYVATRGGMLLHACGVVDEGRGYLFCGRSGAGKSTTAALWEAAGTVLNDDRMLLQRDGAGALRIHGTPWHGDYDRVHAGSAPLHGVFFLEQAKHHHAERVRPAQANRKLLTSVWLPIWDPTGGLPKTLELSAQAVREVPAFTLSFLPNEGVRSTVRAALRAAHEARVLV